MLKVNTKMKISDRLSLVRGHTKKSQTEFSEKLGVSLRTYQSYEKENKDFPSSVAIKINAEYGVNLHWLFTGEGAMLDQDLDKAIEAAVIETRNFCYQNDVVLDPEKEARVICHVVQRILEGGEMSEKSKQSIFRAMV